MMAPGPVRVVHELTAEGIAAAEAEGRYRGRPPALSGTPAEEARTAYLQQGPSIAALSRAYGVSRAPVRTAPAVRPTAGRIRRRVTARRTVQGQASRIRKS